jgi:hypothetical protein
MIQCQNRQIKLVLDKVACTENHHEINQTDSYKRHDHFFSFKESAVSCLMAVYTKILTPSTIVLASLV